MSTSSERPKTPFGSATPFIVPSDRWVRVKFGDTFIADSRQTYLLVQYGLGRLPTYYFPPKNVRQDLLAVSQKQTGGKAFYSVEAGGQMAEMAAWRFVAPPPELKELTGYFSFVWDKMDAWYEEEEEVFVHARDPYKRVDVMPSSRHVKVVIEGVTVAESHRPYLLFETHLPIRYYLRQEDVRMDLLIPTALHTQCPYKGLADYWSVKSGDQVLENLVWSYPDPIPEMPKIKGLYCFFNEKVELYVDGELQPRPRTPWS